MRLWDYRLIHFLSNQRLLGQHRECCALRGKGWGRKHSVVNYVFEHDPKYLVVYHFAVLNEMELRGFKVDSNWWCETYRGKSCQTIICGHLKSTDFLLHYPEHTIKHMYDDVKLLNQKGEHLDIHDVERRLFF